MNYKQLKRTIAKAFVKAGLVGGDTEDSAVMKAQLDRRNAAVSESFVTDERDKEFLKKKKTGHDEDTHLALTPLEGGKTLATVTLPPSISPDNPHYHLVINTVSGHYYEKSHIIPRQNLREEMISHRELGKQPPLAEGQDRWKKFGYHHWLRYIGPSSNSSPAER